jgi:hypothetical protein
VGLVAREQSLQENLPITGGGASGGRMALQEVWVSRAIAAKWAGVDSAMREAVEQEAKAVTEVSLVIVGQAQRAPED